MSRHAICWDLETVPGFDAFKSMNGTPDISDGQAEDLHGDKFAKLPLRPIVCIGAVVAERDDGGGSLHSALLTSASARIARMEAEVAAAYESAKNDPELLATLNKPINKE